MNEADFLQAILDQPDDDVVRLAYADWLMEQPDPACAARGEFIQVQIRLARRDGGTVRGEELKDLARVPVLKAREQELIENHSAEWARPIWPLVADYTFRRGFVEGVEMSCAQFKDSAVDLFSLTSVRRIRFRDRLTQQLASSPLFARLPEVDLSGSCLKDEGLRRLLDAGPLPNLGWLDLSRNGLSDTSMAALAESEVLARLRHLDLGRNSLTVRGVQCLFASPHRGSVRTLVLKGNRAIDTCQAEFISGGLRGDMAPSLLRTVLLMSSREDREYTTSYVRELAARAAGAADLVGALSDGRRKVRAAASRMLARLGQAGVAGLPKVVQRLFERAPRVRDQAAPALARLLGEVPAAMRRWLCLLANPLLPAEANLRAALAAPELPAGVRLRFAEVCARRLAWWKHLTQGNGGAAPAVVPGSYPTDTMSLRGCVLQDLFAAAGRHAARHDRGGERRVRALESGRVKEAAHLLARLTALLQEACDQRSR